MKRILSLFLCAVLILTCGAFDASAESQDDFIPGVAFMTPVYANENESGDTRASGLITSYGIVLSVSGTTLNIRAETYCIADVVKSGFKNLVVERRKSGSSSWSEYYDYGDLYDESFMAALNTNLTVPSGYQYRVSCKHYAKKSLLSTQTISNTSNVVAV